MFHATSEKVSNAVVLFENVRREGDEEGGSGEDDPEELLAHPDDAPDPGEEGEGLYGQLGPGLQNLPIKVDIQTISVRPSVKANVSGFIPFGK